MKQSVAPPSDKAADIDAAKVERTRMVTLALKTLQQFDLDGYTMCLVSFIERSVLNYLDDENP